MDGEPGPRAKAPPQAPGSTAEFNSPPPPRKAAAPRRSAAAFQDAVAPSLASPIVALALLCLLAFTATATPLDWQSSAGHRYAVLTVPTTGNTGFTTIDTAGHGIAFTNRLDDERSITNQIFLNGSGVAAGDVDGDGLCDLYFCGLDTPNALYRNRGEWRFEDVTARAQVACADQASTGAAFADLDGDGDLDLLVNGIARGTRLFLNDGTGSFLEATEASGLGGTTGATSLAIADVDGDGRLDVYVVNYRNDTMRDMPGIEFTVGVTNGVRQLLAVNGRPATDPDLVGRFTFDQREGVLENGEADALFLNLGEGIFVREDWGSGGRFHDERGQPMAAPYDWGLSAMFHDLNGDGAPDLYVCNDFQSPDRIWINDGQGQFQPIGALALRQTSLFSMGMDYADIDRDGYVDFFVADMLAREHARRQVQVMDATAFAQLRDTAGVRPQSLRNMLFRNRGDGTFAEIARLAGVEMSDWSWCPVFLDVDLDGYEDLLITTGHWRDAQHMDVARELDRMSGQRRMSPREQLRQRLRFPRLETPNVAFRNRGDLTFEETGTAWGFDSRSISQAIALADLDNDGDLDVAINGLNHGPWLGRNDSPRPRVAIRLRGAAANTRGVGARIDVRAPGLPLQSQVMIGGGRYLSSDDFLRTFAVLRATDPIGIEVTWRSGRRSVVAEAFANRLYEIDETGAVDPPPQPAATPILPLFEDLSTRLGHGQIDEPYDDFARQPLLPQKLSETGPGLAWFDFNGDGWEDLFIGAGKGGRVAVFRNDTKGGFVPQRSRLFGTPSDRDLTGLLGWHPSPGQPELLIGLDRYELPATNAPGLRRISLVTGKTTEESVPGIGSCGALVMGDVDDDGDLDLFIGGRVNPGRYPEPTSSALWRNDQGRLAFDATASQALRGVGLVSAAVFTRLDPDLPPALVIAGEWGPLRIFRQAGEGSLAAWDPPVRGGDGLPDGTPLSRLTGWWNSISAGDFDHDGRIDLVAGNLGRNSSRQRFLQRPAAPIRLGYGESGVGDTLALLEVHRDPGFTDWVPARDLGALQTSFPALLGRFPTFEAFSTATLADLRNAGLPPLKEVEALFSDSVVLLNRGDHLEVRPLPPEAQFSPVFGLAVADFDGDGNQDLVLAQNLFGVNPAESRYDAGRGAWLRGDGHGGFTTVPASEAGLGIFGEGRAAAVCDFDHDGRPDLAVTQHAGPTLLYRNTQGRPGLRVQLAGPPSNPSAVGAVVRPIDPDGPFGAAQEVRLGGGYLSQDTTTLVVTADREIRGVEIRWPGGRVEQVPLEPGTKELSRRSP